MIKSENASLLDSSTVRTVDESYLGVQYWRDQYKKIAPVFESQREIANEIASYTGVDGITGADWVFHLKNIVQDRASLRITRLAVKAMQLVIDKDPLKKRTLKKLLAQKLS